MHTCHKLLQQAVHSYRSRAHDRFSTHHNTYLLHHISKNPQSVLFHLATQQLRSHYCACSGTQANPTSRQIGETLQPMPQADKRHIASYSTAAIEDFVKALHNKGLRMS